MAHGWERLKRSVGTWVLLVTGILGISTSTLWIRLAEMEEVQLAFLRLALSIPVLLAFALREKHVPFKQGGAAILVSGACLALHFGAWMASLAYLSVATSVVLVYLHPVIVYGIEVWRGRAKPDALRITGVLITLVGTSTLALFSGESGSADEAEAKLIGMTLSVIGSLAFVGYLLAGRSATAKMSTAVYTSRAYSVAALALLVYLWIQDLPVLPIGEKEWGYAFLLALFPTLLGHTPLNAALKRLPPTVVSTSYLGEMAGAPLLVWLVIKEAPPESFWIGGPLVILGITAVAWKGDQGNVENSSESLGSDPGITEH
ncbi:MAG TPA: hypothetical protein DGU45_02700 [Planctomycetes bacterium]|nr:hypothetical protein [Planctomycetota bacterium]